MIRSECKRNVFERIRKCCFIQDFRIGAENWNFKIGTQKSDYRFKIELQAEKHAHSTKHVLHQVLICVHLIFKLNLDWMDSSRNSILYVFL